MRTGLWKRFKAMARRKKMDREMAEELAFHQAALHARFLREGMSETQADAAVRRQFGSSSRWQERLRELWQFRALENFGRDLRFAVRLLWKSPGFTTVALLTLALGIGANTAVFSIINGLLLRPIDVPENHRLAVLSYLEKDTQPSYEFCAPYLRGLEKRKGAFENIFAFNADNMQVKGASGNETVHGMEVTGEFFEGLRTPPMIGRYLTPADDRPGTRVVVISEGFWERWFDRAPDIAGRKLVIANVPFTVVGVMPKQFIGADPTQRPEIFAPIEASAVIDAPRDLVSYGVHAWWLTVMGRLRPGATLQQANAGLQSVSNAVLVESTTEAGFVADQQKQQFLLAAESGSKGFTFIRTLFRKPLTVMIAMCGGILLLACMNLASLLMARAAARERELATRLAIGATRGRLISQLLIESLVIALAGTALGMALAPLVTRSIAGLLMGGNMSQITIDTAVDLRVFVFATLLACVAALVIGLIPALQATGSDLNEQMKQGHHATRSYTRRRLVPRVLMSAQVALALVLVTGAGLLATSLVKLYRSGAGFDPQGIVNIQFSMDKQQLDGDALMQVYRQLGDGLRRQPGVKDVSFQFIVPLSGRGWNGEYAAPGKSKQLIWLNSVGPDYFGTMRIPMLAGREFTWNDTKASGLKIILSQTAAKLFFSDRNPIGQHIEDPREKKSYEVVAVVGDVKYRDMRRLPPPEGFVPIRQDDQKKPSLYAVVRTDGPLVPLAEASRRLAAQIAPEIPPPMVLPMSDILDTSLGAERMMAVLAVFFAACALLVTAIGLYGTLAYATERRTSEIGIRLALGAQRLNVLWMIFRQNTEVAISGCVAGLACAVLASKVLSSFLYETSPRDPWVLVCSIASLAAVASAASLLPAVRAAQTDPMTAIRCE